MGPCLSKQSKDSRKKSEDSQKKSEDSRKKSEDSRKKSEDSQKKSEDSRKKSEKSRKKSEDSQKKKESEDSQKKKESDDTRKNKEDLLINGGGELIMKKEAPIQFELPNDHSENEVHKKDQENIISPNNIEQKTENVLVHDEQGHEIRNRIVKIESVESQNRNDLEDLSPRRKSEEIKRTNKKNRDSFFQSLNDKNLPREKPIEDAKSVNNQKVKQGKVTHNDGDVGGDKQGISKTNKTYDILDGSMQIEDTDTEGKNDQSYPMAETENRVLKIDHHQLIITNVISQDESIDFPLELMEISQVTPEQHAEKIQQNDCEPIETEKINLEIDKNTTQNQKMGQVTESIEFAHNHLPIQNEQILDDPQLNETAPCVSKDNCQQNCESVQVINGPDQNKVEDSPIAMAEYVNDISGDNNCNLKGKTKNKADKSKQQNDNKKDKDNKSDENKDRNITPNNLNKSDSRDSYSSDGRYNQDSFDSDYRDPKPSIPQYKRDVVPPSLTNIGATCYLNSAFQGISACDIFVKEIDDLCNLYSGEGVTQLHVFKELIDILNGCSRNHMEISRNSIFRNWNKPGQQDSYELLAYALNQVYNQLRKHKENTKEIPKRDLKKWLEVKLPMRFIIQYEIKCGCGLTTYSPLQSDLALHVTIPSKEERCVLSKLVDLYFGNDPIEDYECDKHGCDGKNTNRIARLAKPLPHTICIHLQRTFWNGYAMKKINKPISFGTTLILKSEYWSKKEEPEATEMHSNNIVKEEVTNNTDNQASTIAEDISVTLNKTEGAQGDVENGISVTITESIDLCNIGGDNLSNINNKDEHIDGGDNYIVTTGTTNTVLPLVTNAASSDMDMDGKSHVQEKNKNLGEPEATEMKNNDVVKEEVTNNMDNKASTIVEIISATSIKTEGAQGDVPNGISATLTESSSGDNLENINTKDEDIVGGDNGVVTTDRTDAVLPLVTNEVSSDLEKNTNVGEPEATEMNSNDIVKEEVTNNTDNQASTIVEDISVTSNQTEGTQCDVENGISVTITESIDLCHIGGDNLTNKDEHIDGGDNCIVTAGTTDTVLPLDTNEVSSDLDMEVNSPVAEKNADGSYQPSLESLREGGGVVCQDLDNQMIVDEGNRTVVRGTINTKEGESQNEVLEGVQDNMDVDVNSHVPEKNTSGNFQPRLGTLKEGGSSISESEESVYHESHDQVMVDGGNKTVVEGTTNTEEEESHDGVSNHEPISNNGTDILEPPKKKNKSDGDITQDCVEEMDHCDGSITCNGNNTAIVVPDQLSSDTTKGVLLIEKDVKPKLESTKPVENDKTYDLVSVIVHSGTVYGGHYICYKRVDEKWFLTNDSSVHEVSENSVLNCQAYILFYEQRDDDIHSVE